MVGMAIENFKRARHYQYSVSILEPTIVGPGKAFRKRSSQAAGKRSFEFGFWK